MYQDDLEPSKAEIHCDRHMGGQTRSNHDVLSSWSLVGLYVFPRDIVNVGRTLEKCSKYCLQ
jgi:hypothetical protein